MSIQNLQLSQSDPQRRRGAGGNSTARKTRVPFDELPDAALVPDTTVGTLFSVSRVTVWRWVKQGHLPAPVKVGTRAGWNVGALRRILAGGQEVRQ